MKAKERANPLRTGGLRVVHGLTHRGYNVARAAGAGSWCVEMRRTRLAEMMEEALRGMKGWAFSGTLADGTAERARNCGASRRMLRGYPLNSRTRQERPTRWSWCVKTHPIHRCGRRS